MSDDVSVEAAGETVGEAKWAALRELEALVPGLDRETVRFQVVSEGERGLLGVGYTPARVLAVAAAEPSVTGEEAPPLSPEAALVQELLDRTIAALDLSARARVDEDDETIRATIVGGDVSVLIGRHGHTLDSLQHLATSLVRRSADAPRRVVVDGGGYRQRRASTVDGIARRAAERATATGQRVALEPMSAVERRLVHEALKDDPSVATASEGDEPHRYVVVSPRRVAD